MKSERACSAFEALQDLLRAGHSHNSAHPIRETQSQSKPEGGLLLRSAGQKASNSQPSWATDFHSPNLSRRRPGRTFIGPLLVFLSLRFVPTRLETLVPQANADGIQLMQVWPWQYT